MVIYNLFRITQKILFGCAKKKRKTLSLTLALCLVFSLFSWCGILSVAEEIIPPDNNEIIQTAEPDEEAIPYLRLYEDETDLSEVAYLNTDGTVTKTFYPYPVKYTDKDGNVKDISLDIEETKDGYATKENSVITEFGNELSDGIV